MGLLDDLKNAVGVGGSSVLDMIGGGGGSSTPSYPIPAYNPQEDLLGGSPTPVGDLGTGTLLSGGGGGSGGGQPDIPLADVVLGLMNLGYDYEDAYTIATTSPDIAIGLIQQGGATPSGGGSGGGGGGGSTAGIDLGYAQLAESQRQFDLEYQTGIQQFQATFDRKNFESDREYELAKQQFAQTYAENKRQFDLEYGLSSELGRGNLALGQDRLALDRELGTGQLQLGRDQLNLDSELGRGRLALDTELGRGNLDLGNRRLALDDRLGTGRLNLDTELGRGQLGINQQAEARLQRAQVASERLANRDQELQRTQFVTDVLRKPSDFLARAFLQRGGTAPTGMVTQADIINNLKNSINQFAQGGVTNDSVFTTGEQGGASSTELILNPANAPLQILNPQDTQQVMNAPTQQAAPQWGDLMGRLGTWRQQLQSQWPNFQPNMQQLRTNAIVNVNPAEAASPTWGSFQRPNLNPRSGGGGGGMQGRLAPPQNPFMQGAPVMGGGGPTGSPSIQPVGGGYNPGAMQPGSQPDWNAAMQATNGTINPMTLPNVTQQQLVDIGLANLPPAVKSALFGGASDIPAARPVAGLTLGRLARLTPGELEALNTQLGVQFNTDLQNEMALLQERFGPVVNRARGRLVVQ